MALATVIAFTASVQCTLGQAVYTNPKCFAVRAVVENGHALASDGKGPYVEGQDEARVQARGALSVWAWRHTDGLRNKPDPAATAPQLRSLKFDLDHPVPGGGAHRLGIVNDPVGRFHAFWKREGNTLVTFTQIPVGQTVLSDRIEMWVFSSGHQYVLQMGPWVMGLFSPRAGISAKGTSQARITRDSETEWVIAAPPGSVARLSNYDDTNAPRDVGLYYFDFLVRVNTMENARCFDIR